MRIIKHISFYPNEDEARDFELVKKTLMRRSNSDTIRVMIQLSKKILSQNINILIEPNQK